MVSTIDFRYITDVITPNEAIEILQNNQMGKQKRVEELLKIGYPCYTTQIGWLGYSDEYRRQLCKDYLKQGFNAFKLKVGRNLVDDRHRCQLVREEIGWENKLVTANHFSVPFDPITINSDSYSQFLILDGRCEPDLGYKRGH